MKSRNEDIHIQEAIVIPLNQWTKLVIREYLETELREARGKLTDLSACVSDSCFASAYASVGLCVTFSSILMHGAKTTDLLSFRRDAVIGSDVREVVKDQWLISISESDSIDGRRQAETLDAELCSCTEGVEAGVCVVVVDLAYGRGV
jgi:hypothetical protein